MSNYLSQPKLHTNISKDTTDTILPDKDHNSILNYDEFHDMVVGSDYMTSDRLFVRHALIAPAFTEVARNERRYLADYSCFPPPLFVILISCLEIGVFIYHTIPLIQKYGWIGITGPAPFDSLLIYDPYRRNEAWRFLTYMLVHAGFTHITLNVLMQLLLGIPLEMMYQGWRIIIIYLAGVIAGSLATSVSDPHVFLCGASGGVYALITCHLVVIIFNWQKLEFPWFRIFAFVVITGSDIGVTIYQRLKLEEKNKVGHMAHLGGAVAGLLVGITVLRKLRPRRWEKVVWWFSLTLYLILMIAAIVWNVMMMSIDPRFPPARYRNTAKWPF